MDPPALGDSNLKLAWLPAPGKGHGLFTATSIPRGTVISVYNSIIVNKHGDEKMEEAWAEKWGPNHDCSPNLCQLEGPNKFITLRAIDADTELTTSYLGCKSWFLTRAQRQRKTCGEECGCCCKFKCVCETCSLDGPESEQEDERREELHDNLSNIRLFAHVARRGLLEDKLMWVYIFLATAREAADEQYSSCDGVNPVKEWITLSIAQLKRLQAPIHMLMDCRALQFYFHATKAQWVTARRCLKEAIAEAEETRAVCMGEMAWLRKLDLFMRKNGKCLKESAPTGKKYKRVLKELDQHMSVWLFNVLPDVPFPDDEDCDESDYESDNVSDDDCLVKKRENSGRGGNDEKNMVSLLEKEAEHGKEDEDGAGKDRKKETKREQEDKHASIKGKV